MNLHVLASDYKALGTTYKNAWYERQVVESYHSAQVYVDYLWRIFQPQTVVDIGCGRGAWLKAWHEQGTQSVIGFDGAWNHQDNMMDPAIVFTAMDLNRPNATNLRADLSMSLEVAEHLQASSAAPFVESLTKVSDTVLFGAAFKGQGGNNHINEQHPSYWAHIFGRCGYVPFDLLRPVFWNDMRVCYWYRQNTFIYVRQDSKAFHRLTAQGLQPLTHIAFMDCVHPELYDAKRGINADFKTHLRYLLPSFVRGIKRRLKPPPKL